MRPLRLIAVVGTGTEVGKTWVACALLRAWRARGVTVAARKLAQSFEPGTATDATLLADASGQPAADVCPPGRSYPVPLAPPMAAQYLGLPVPTLSDLIGSLTWPAGVDAGLVETAGGLRSPIAGDGDNIALLSLLTPDAVVLVADAGLGTLNAVRLSVDALGSPPVVFLNRFDPAQPLDLHTRNRAWLASRDGYEVFVDVDELAERLMPSS